MAGRLPGYLPKAMSDHTDSKLLYPELPEPKLLIAAIPPKRTLQLPSAFDKIFFQQRRNIENIFDRLKTSNASQPLRYLRPHLALKCWPLYYQAYRNKRRAKLF